MYAPGPFSVDDPGELAALVAAHPFAALVVASAEGPVAAFAPLLMEAAEDGGRVLIGHLAAANPLLAAWRPGVRALALFRAGDAYVSPSFYPSKTKHGRVVPTWNHIAAEAAGPLELIREPAALRSIVTRLTLHMENQREAPWAVSDAPAAYVDALLGAIVGLRLRVERLHGVRKLSQNKSAADRAGVRSGLAASTSPADRLVAAAMAAATAAPAD